MEVREGERVMEGCFERLGSTLRCRGTLAPLEKGSGKSSSSSPSKSPQVLVLV